MSRRPAPAPIPRSHAELKARPCNEIRIRDFERTRDLEAVRRCFIELQDVERAIDDRMPPGSEVVDAYLELLFKRAEMYLGKILVAESDGQVVGYVSVWAKTWSDEPDDGIVEHAYITDLVVLPTHRRLGIAGQLLETAEAYAKSHGAQYLRLGLKGGNARAKAFYLQAGFDEFELQLEKSL